MDQGQGAADDQARDIAVFLLGGDAQDGQDEDAGQDGFDDEAGQGIPVIQGVGAQLGCILHHQLQHAGAGDGAHELSHHVADEVLHGHLLRAEHGDGDGGIDVAAGDVADGVGHGHDHQAEGRTGHAQGAAGLAGHAAGHEHQHEGAQALRQILFHVFHFNFPP